MLKTFANLLHGKLSAQPAWLSRRFSSGLFPPGLERFFPGSGCRSRERLEHMRLSGAERLFAAFAGGVILLYGIVSTVVRPAMFSDSAFGFLVWHSMMRDAGRDRARHDYIHGLRARGLVRALSSLRVSGPDDDDRHDPLPELWLRFRARKAD